MDVNERHRAKLEARRTGKAPVFVEPPKVTGVGIDQASIEARYRQKLEVRGAMVAAAAPAVPPPPPTSNKPADDKPPVETEADRKKRERAEERARKDAEAERLKAEEDAAAKAEAEAKAKADREAKELEELEKQTRPDNAPAKPGNTPAQK